MRKTEITVIEEIDPIGNESDLEDEFKVKQHETEDLASLYSFSSAAIPALTNNALEQV
jgi:hypothetical protein